MRHRSHLVVLILFACALVAGCKSSFRPIQPMVTSTPIDDPPIGVESRSELGETLVKKGTQYLIEGQAIEMQDDLVATRFGVETRIPKQTMLATAEDDDWTYFSAANVYTRFPLRSDTVGPGGMTMAKSSSDWIEIYGTLGPEDAASLDRPSWMKVTTATKTDDKRNSYVQELLYNGRIGNRVSFLYREFQNDVARPAFTQEITYDLAEGKEVGFKGARLEIIDANNRYIRYRVLNSFPDPAASAKTKP
jgi:hypothetical protein